MRKRYDTSYGRDMRDRKVVHYTDLPMNEVIDSIQIVQGGNPTPEMCREISEYVSEKLFEKYRSSIAVDVRPSMLNEQRIWCVKYDGDYSVSGFSGLEATIQDEVRELLIGYPVN